MEFTQENFTNNIIADIEEMATDNWNEVASGVLDVNWDSYRQLENAGIAKLFCYYDETEMVGYAIFIVADSVHSMGLMQATCTVMYVKPEYRKGGAGARFIYNCQKDLLEMGADVMIMAVKPSSDYSNSLIRMGFAKLETLYDKRLN